MFTMCFNLEVSEGTSGKKSGAIARKSVLKTSGMILFSKIYAVIYKAG